VTPPLGELYDLLRADGFPIGVDDHVRIGRLLARDATWSLDTLKVAITALVVKDVRDRPRFDACWERWMHASAARVEEQRAPAPAPSPRRWPRAVGAAAAVLAGALVVWFVARGQHAAAPPAVQDAGPPPADAPTQAPTGPSSSFVPPPTRTDVPPPPKHSSPPEPAHDARAAALAIAAAGVGFLIVLAGAASLVARRRRQFLPGPWRYRVDIPDAKKPALSRLDIEDGAADLTWQANEPGHELDIDRTVARTAAAGGMPVIAYRRPPAAPRYLVLEDVGPGTERWRFLYDELLAGLAREGVEIERATFVGSPDVCRTKEGKDVPLRDLLEQMDAMLAIGDGATAIDPLTGERADWLATLRHVPRRLWINPLPTARWSEGARAIAVDTPMENGIAHALAALHAGVDRTDLERAFPAIIERAPATTTALAALRTYLGERAFQLAGAVATAGQPTITAARWLAEQLELRLEEQEWLRIVALPWFVTERWPESPRAPDGSTLPGLRDRLREILAIDTPDLATRVEVLADRVLAASEPRAGSAAHLAWQLDRAERAGGDYAARELGRITTTPLAHAARQRLAAMRLPDRRRRWAIAAVTAACFLTLSGGGLLLATRMRDSHELVDYAARAKERRFTAITPSPVTVQLPDMPKFVARVVDGNGDAVAGANVFWGYQSQRASEVTATSKSDADGITSSPLIDKDDSQHEGAQEVAFQDHSDKLAWKYSVQPAPVEALDGNAAGYAPPPPVSSSVATSDELNKYAAQAQRAGASNDCHKLELSLSAANEIIRKQSPSSASSSTYIAKNNEVIQNCWSQRAANAVLKVVADNKPYLVRNCYSQKPNLPTRAQMTGTLDKDGHFKKLDVTGLDGGSVEHCIVNELKNSPAGRYDHDVDFKAPLDFSPPAVGPPGKGGSLTKGTLTSDIAQGYINKNRAAIDLCYEPQKAEDPTVTGRVDAKFMIQANTGKVISVTTTGFTDQVRQCVKKVIFGIQFPAVPDIEEDVEINYSFDFPSSSPGDKKPAAPQCDEVGCIMDPSQPCCAKFKKGDAKSATGPIKITQTIRFSGDVNSVEPTEDEEPILKDVAAILNANPTLRVRVVGYSGEAPTGEKDALEWAKERAERVIKRLGALGVDTSRLTAVAGPLGEPTTDPAEQQRRRRVEFVVVSPSSPKPSKKGK
jgi:outer membrane protein OmpA-like peptidoglycan-associated protein